MSEEIPEHVRDYFGHDKVALFGSGGMPAAPPAPPGSPARRAGETALADALSKVGEPGPRVGERPVVRPPAPSLKRGMRLRTERALMEASMRRHGRVPPHTQSPRWWSALLVPYQALPWSVKRRIVSAASGVRGWRPS